MKILETNTWKWWHKIKIWNERWLHGVNFKISRCCVESVAYCEMFRSGLHNSLLDSIFGLYWIQELQNAKFSLTWEGDTPSQTLAPLGRSAPSQFSSEVRSLGFSTPPPKKFRLPACVTMVSFKSHHEFCSYQIRRQTHNRWPRSVGLGGGGGG